MRVLAACERSGTIRDAFRKKGHDAWSCDLFPADDNSEFHIQGNILDHLDDDWDLIIACPPCIYLCSSGYHWLSERKKKTEEEQEKEKLRVQKRKIDVENAKQFFLKFTKLDCSWCIENPIGIMSKIYRKPNQYVQPYNFGENASKKTCFWLNKLPLLKNTLYIEPRKVLYKDKIRKRWGNQTNSGQNNLPPSKERSKLRSKTYEGIAAAMADQWGNLKK